MNGCPVRSRASEQPVHSALCRYTTEGRRGMVNARATCSANPVPMPIVTATMLQNFRKSRRDTPCRSSRASTFSFPRPTAIRIRFSLFSGRQDVGHMRGSKWSEPLPHPLGVSSVKTTKPGRCPHACGRNAAPLQSAASGPCPKASIFPLGENNARPPPLRNSPV